MKVLIVGGTGLIGSAIAARLIAAGHAVVVASRHRPPDTTRYIEVDLVKATEAFWLPHLRGVGAVINCAGVLQDAPGESTAATHHTGIANLFRACAEVGVRKVIHFSAIGVDQATPSDFSRSKLAGDEALMPLDLDWVILRPSVVFGRTAYGATALMRGLAALPVLPIMPEGGKLQIVWLDDVTATVEHLVSDNTAARQVIELVGPETYTFEQFVALLRAWMRWPPAATFEVPKALAGLIYRVGDLISLLGWRPPIRSTARREMLRGAVASASSHRMPIQPTNLRDALAAEPASVQERWFAKMYFVKPIALIVIVAFWIFTAYVSLGPGWEIGINLMRQGGIEGPMAGLVVTAGALADLCIGIAIAWRRTNRLGLYAAIGLSVAYAVIGTILIPHLWIEPLGPMAKIWPIVVLHMAMLAVREDR